VESALFLLHQQSLLLIPKNESSDIDDILLHFDNPDGTTDPIYLSNELFPPFIPQPYALVMVLPVHFPRQEHLISFLKSSLFHVYAEQANLLSRVISREIFYKNSTVRGIYFIEEG
jgi:hypothetical protein